MKRFLLVTVLLILLPTVALAHHGGVSLALGPGSPIETSSPLTLPDGGFVVSTKVEQVEFQKFQADAPENKDSFTFYNLGVSYGVTPYLTTSLFMPYSIKRQDSLGSNRGLGDLKFSSTLGFNYEPDSGLRLNSSNDTAVTLEGNRRTYFGIIGGFSLPTGQSHEQLDNQIERDMQPGFRSPSFSIGAAVARQIAGSLSMAASTTYDVFTQSDNFKFGNEWRVDLAGIYELYGKTEALVSKIDGILEFNFLRLQRDEDGGQLKQGSGGNILYISPGMRFAIPRVQNANVGILLKFPLVKSLNEQQLQQGSEGLEKVRAIATVSFYF
ncbi:MAG: transporter [Nitrospirae bacterium]|nr:transporter [Nitrospirota bacterium]MBF0591959.1 transporter [Nitrospirota bacterium]